jgi:hypothetical protein
MKCFQLQCAKFIVQVVRKINMTIIAKSFPKR